MASLANTASPRQLITGNIKLKDGVYTTQNLLQSELSINLKDTLTNGTSLPKSELNYEARNIIKDQLGNLYVFGVYGFPDGNLNGGGWGPGNNFKTTGKFVAKIDSDANIVYINTEDPNIQAPWYQTPLISTSSNGSLSLAVNIDNSGGMPSQGRNDVSYAGITLNSNRGGFVKRLSSNGDVKWVVPVTGDDIYSYLQSIIADDNGNTYVFWGDVGWWAGKNITKIDENGNILWTANTFGGGSAYAPYVSFVGIDHFGNPLLAAVNGYGSPSLFLVNKDNGIAESMGIGVSQDQWRNFSFISPNNKPTGTPTLSGTLKAGQVITIDSTPIKDVDNFTGYTPTYNYSFEVSNDNGATWTKLISTDATDNNSTYTLTTAEVGKKVRGVVSYLDGYGTNEVVNSATSIAIETVTPTYTLTPSATSINEGATLTTVIATTNVATGTKLYYALSGTGITTADFSVGALTGEGNVGSDGKFTFSHTLSNDLTKEGAETLSIKLYSDGARTVQVGLTATVGVVDTSKATPTYTLTPSATSINEGKRLTTTITTTGVDSLSKLYYSLSGTGITTADFSIGNLTGEGTTDSWGKFTFFNILANDLTTEGAETLSIKLYSDSARTVQVGSTATVLIEDTSVQIEFTGTINNDVLTGNSANNTIKGLGGADILTGSEGADTFVYALADSRLAAYDHITDLAIGTDLIDAPNALSAANLRELGAVSALTQAGIAGVLTTATFVRNGAATFSFGTGSSTRTFLALNDGIAGYSSTADGLIEITGFTGALTNLALI